MTSLPARAVRERQRRQARRQARRHSARQPAVAADGRLKARDWLEVLISIIAAIFAACFLVWSWPR
jgi:hypothetical protein